MERIACAAGKDAVFATHGHSRADGDDERAAFIDSAATRFDGQVTVLRSLLEEGHDLVE